MPAIRNQKESNNIFMEGSLWLGVDMIERLSRELMFKGSRIDMYTDSVKLPNGNVGKWDFISHMGAAAVVPVTDDGKLIMVRQYRNALDRETVEIPAGGLNSPDEPTMEAALRELEEETGYYTEKLELLISLVPAIAYSNEVIDIYVARNLINSKQNTDDDEFIDVEEYTVEDLCSMIYDGKIQDSKTIAAVLAYKDKYC